MSQPVRQALLQASQEAASLNAGSVQPESLLLALVQLQGSGAARCLEYFGIGYLDVRKQVTRLIGVGESQGDAPVPFDLATEEVIAVANQQPGEREGEHVTTTDLLLALVRDDKSVSSIILRELGVDIDQLRERAKGQQVPGVGERLEGFSGAGIRGIVDRLDRIEYMLDIINNQIAEMKLDTGSRE